MIAILLSLLISTFSVAGDSLAAKPAPDDDAGRTGIIVSPIIIPAAFYSPIQGFGAGFGIGVRNAFWPGSYWALTAEPSQHRGLYALQHLTGNTKRVPVFGYFRAAYELTGVRGFSGLGPASRAENAISLKKEGWMVEGRVGIQFFDNRLLVQPLAHYEWHLGHRVRERREGALDRLDERSRNNLLYVIGEWPGVDASERLHGVSGGLHMAFDTRDSRAYPSSGVVLQATGRRFEGVGSGIRFDSYHAAAHAFFSAGGRNVLALRANLAMTDSRGPDPVPFYLLPTLDVRTLGAYDQYRLTGNDALWMNAEYRVPLVNLLEMIQVHTFALVGVGNVYDDVFEQFDARVSFRKNPEAEGGRFPLRPAFALGGRLETLVADETLVEGIIGWGPEGLVLFSFSFVFDLRTERLPIW